MHAYPKMFFLPQIPVTLSPDQWPWPRYDQGEPPCQQESPHRWSQALSLANREFWAACCLIIISNSGLLSSHRMAISACSVQSLFSKFHICFSQKETLTLDTKPNTTKTDMNKYTKRYSNKINIKTKAKLRRWAWKWIKPILTAVEPTWEWQIS